MINKLINTIKNNSFLYEFISKIKGLLFDYKFKILENKWISNHQNVVSIINYSTTSVKSKLNVIWCGINENQDNSGLIQGLMNNFNTLIYYRSKNNYGLKNNTSIDENFIHENGKNLFNYVKLVSKKQKIDFLIGQFMGININSYWLENIRKLGIKTISLSWDDKLVFLWNKNYKISCHSISSSLDYVLGSSLYPLNVYNKTKPIFFPLASSPEIFSGNPRSEKTIDVLFIGNQYGTRRDIIKYLKSNNINVECYGNDWGTRFLSFEESALKFKQAKIIIGIGYVSHSRKITTLKLRDFDASISGALYITSKNEELELLFPDNQLVFYGNKKELLDKIKFYLKNENKRIEKASVLQKYVLDNFTWDILFNKLDAYLKLN